MMDQAAERRIDHPQSRSPTSESEIHVVVDDTVRLIEAAKSIEYLAAHEHAGSSHRDDIALRQGLAERPRVLGWSEAECVPPNRAVEEHAGVLDRVCRVQKQRA